MIIHRASGRVSSSLLCLYVCFLLCDFLVDFLLFCCISSLFLVYYQICDVIEVAVVPESLRLVPQEAQQKPTPALVILLKKPTNKGTLIALYIWCQISRVFFDGLPVVCLTHRGHQSLPYTQKI